MIVYLIIRSQSTDPTKPKLSIDCQSVDETKPCLPVNKPEYKYDEVTIQSETPESGVPFSVGPGILKNDYSSCQIRKFGIGGNIRELRGFLLKYALLEIRGAMSGRKVVMNWTLKHDNQHDCAYVHEGDNLHYWWELVTIEVSSK